MRVLVDTSVTRAANTGRSRLGDGGFRSNVGFLNPGEAPVSVVARLFDGSIGVELGTLERTVAPLGWLQVDDVFAEAGVPGSAVDRSVVVTMKRTNPFVLPEKQKSAILDK